MRFFWFDPTIKQGYINLTIRIKLGYFKLTLTKAYKLTVIDPARQEIPG